MRSNEGNKERYLQTLAGNIPDRVPIHETVFDRRFIRHKTGLSDFSEYTQSLGMPARALIPLVESIPFDMVTVGHAFRQKLSTWNDLKALQLPSHDAFLTRVDSFIHELQGRQIGLIVYVHGPLDSTYLSMGYENFFLASVDDPALVAEIMDVYTDYSLSLIYELIKRPIDVIQLVDDIAMSTGTFINPVQQNELWFPRMQKLVEPLHSAGIPCQFHSDGGVKWFVDMLLKLGIAAMNPVDPNCNSLREVKHKYGDRITLMGNMDIGGTLANGTPDDVRREMREILGYMMEGGRYIAMSGSSISDAVVPENYEAMVETVLRYGKY